MMGISWMVKDIQNRPIFTFIFFFSLNPYTVLKSWLSSKVPLLYTHGSVAFAKMIIGKKETTANSPSTWAKVELNKGTGRNLNKENQRHFLYLRKVCVCGDGVKVLWKIMKKHWISKKRFLHAHHTVSESSTRINSKLIQMTRALCMTLKP